MISSLLGQALFKDELWESHRSTIPFLHFFGHEYKSIDLISIQSSCHHHIGWCHRTTSFIHEWNSSSWQCICYLICFIHRFVTQLNGFIQFMERLRRSLIFAHVVVTPLMATQSDFRCPLTRFGRQSYKEEIWNPMISNPSMIVSSFVILRTICSLLIRRESHSWSISPAMFSVLRWLRCVLTIMMSRF